MTARFVDWMYESLDLLIGPTGGPLWSDARADESPRLTFREAVSSYL